MNDTMMKDSMQEDQMNKDRMHEDKMDSGMKDSGMSDDKMMQEKMHKETMMAPMMSMLSGSDGHHAAGKVTLSEEMGKYVLTLADIKVDKVPDGQVYLSKGADRKSASTLACSNSSVARSSSPCRLKQTPQCTTV